MAGGGTQGRRAGRNSVPDVPIPGEPEEEKRDIIIIIW